MFAGQWGVDLFFILSGFIIYHVTRERSNWGNFAIKRIFRIYPLYWLCLCAYAIYNNVDFTISSFLQNVMMIPFFGPISSKSLVVGQAWSTCYEIYFYAVFTLILLSGISKKRIIPVLLLLYVGGFVSRKLGLFSGNGFVAYLYSLISTIPILFFMLGIIISMIYNRYKEQLNKYVLQLTDNKCIVLCVGGGILILFSVVLLKYSWIVSLGWAVVLFSLFLIFNFLIGHSKGIFAKILLWLGDISFSIYLTHSLIIKVLMNILR